MKSYANKTVVITGSASGIGLALAHKFGADGANIVICDLDQIKIDNAVAGLADQGFNVAGTLCDVTQEKDLTALADFAEAQFGHIDVLVNNAGTASRPSPLCDTDMATVRRIMDTNLMGVIQASQIFAARFLEQERPGAIYNVGSENSFFAAVPMSYAYIASKHGVLAVTEQMAEEYAGRIEVKLICPGLVETGMTQGIPGAMPADEFAGIVFEQLKAEDNFFIVSHAYNIKRIDARYEHIRAAYAQYAPRHDGDIAMDVRHLLAQRQAAKKS